MQPELRKICVAGDSTVRGGGQSERRRLADGAFADARRSYSAAAVCFRERRALGSATASVAVPGAPPGTPNVAGRASQERVSGKQRPSTFDVSGGAPELRRRRSRSPRPVA